VRPACGVQIFDAPQQRKSQKLLNVTA